MANGFEQNDVFFGFTHLWSALKENDMTIGGKHKPIRGAPARNTEQQCV